jgi:hypothetical protein
METNYCCFMTLPPGAAHYPKTTEFKAKNLKLSHYTGWWRLGEEEI